MHSLILMLVSCVNYARAHMKQLLPPTQATPTNMRNTHWVLSRTRVAIGNAWPSFFCNDGEKETDENKYMNHKSFIQPIINVLLSEFVLSYRST